jgi:hypothetical protein
VLCLWKARPLRARMSQRAPAPVTGTAVGLSSNSVININITVICSVTQLMRIPVSFSGLRTQGLVDTGASASFLAHRLLINVPYGKVKEINTANNSTQLFRTVSGELVKPRECYELNIKLARRHSFKHPFCVISELEEKCILGYDFLAANEIIINPSERSINYKQDNELKKLIIPPLQINSISIVDPPQFNLEGIPKTHKENLKNLLISNFSLFTENLNELGKAKSVKHFIRTTALIFNF